MSHNEIVGLDCNIYRAIHSFGLTSWAVGPASTATSRSLRSMLHSRISSNKLVQHACLILRPEAVQSRKACRQSCCGKAIGVSHPAATGKVIAVGNCDGLPFLQHLMG